MAVDRSSLIPFTCISLIIFIWGGTNDKRRVHLIKWDTVTRCKENGGLGLRKMSRINKAFMAKLGWRLLLEKESLWA